MSNNRLTAAARQKETHIQTFLPYPDFAESAAVLDSRRLGKQRVETMQIMRTLTGLSSGWQNHPAVRMWRGCELRLAEYGIAVCDRWIGLGYHDTCRDKILSIVALTAPIGLDWRKNAPSPHWLGDEAFHASHRAALLAKDPKWYGVFGWTETPEVAYVWPKAAEVEIDR